MVTPLKTLVNGTDSLTVAARQRGASFRAAARAHSVLKQPLSPNVDFAHHMRLILAIDEQPPQSLPAVPMVRH